MAKVDRKLIKTTPFKDISLSFARHPITDDIGVFINEDAIKRSVTNLVRTRVGERFYQKFLGSPLEDSLFDQQDTEYKTNILGDGPRVAIECGYPDFWHKYLNQGDLVIGMESFGESAPIDQLAEKFNFSAEIISDEIRSLRN